MMKEQDPREEIRILAHNMLMITMIILTVILVVLNRLFGWEIWMVPVLIAGAFLCIALQFVRKLSEDVRFYVCGAFLIVESFYFIVNVPMICDSTVMIVILIFLFALAQRSILVNIGWISGIIGMIVHLLKDSGEAGFSLDLSLVIRVGWQLIALALVYILVLQMSSSIRRIGKKYDSRIAQLEQENIRINNFLANVSHEIRTPVNAVMGLSSVIEQSAPGEDISESVEAISEAGRRVARQISDILDYTEIDMNKLTVSKESYMIVSLVNDILTDLSAYSFEKKEVIIDLETEVPAELMGDPDKIKKILHHLISNSRKYTPGGGIYVHIGAIPRSYGINLVIDVEDTGIGISDENIERIFGKFYQTDGGRTRQAGGLGLGISIVDGFVKAMGGFFSITSRLNEGTSARVSIPQQVVDPSFCISVSQAKDVCVVGFFSHPENDNPKVRDFYQRMLGHLSSGISPNFYSTTTVQELTRFLESHTVTHLFIGQKEYLENKEYIDHLSLRIAVAVYADPEEREGLSLSVTPLSKPFYSARIASFINNTDIEGVSEMEMEGGRMVCPGLSVLVVDDEPMNLLVAKGIFETYEMKVDTAPGGWEAIEACEEKDYDVIFMDHMMPQMDGVEAMKHLRMNAARRRKKLCIVALTANAISSAREMFLSEGFDGFIPKPIVVTELERVLKHILPASAISYRAYGRVGFASEKTPEKEDVSDGILSKKGTLDEAFAKEDVSDAPPAKKDVEDVLEAAGIFMGTGLVYCNGDKDFYYSVLEEYARDGVRKTEELKKFYSEKDWKNYEIHVHSLKSTSRTIGAEGLSELAAELERAAKAEAEDLINELHPRVLSLYKTVYEAAGITGVSGGEKADEEVVLEFLPEDHKR